jgi:hypothetical protein
MPRFRGHSASPLTTFGLWARVKTLSITLTGLSHTFPSDLDFLFVGPDGTNLVFWSDAGSGIDISNQNYTIRDSAAASLPLSGGIGGIASGIYRPTDYDSVETNGNWAGVSPDLVINHAAPNGAATLDDGGAFKIIKESSAVDACEGLPPPQGASVLFACEQSWRVCHRSQRRQAAFTKIFAAPCDLPPLT